MSQYQSTWNSLRTKKTSEWFRNAKFGIYTHWGIYCVPACGPNCTWYPYYMYREGNPQFEHHVKTYGHPSQFGYKDFIPQFTAERFDADEWAEMIANSGAKFAGPVGEHHDGFSMWNSKSNPWNSMQMGPKRDVVGELEKAYRAKGLRYLVAMHHAENWWFYPHWRAEFDTSDPRYSGLYGEPHNPQGPSRPNGFFDQVLPSQAFLKQWRTRLDEVIDNYSPDMIWFDFGISLIDERYLLDFLASFYNGGDDRIVTYKDDHVPPNVAVLDYELGRESKLTYHEWLTDSTVDDGCAWGYMNNATYKSPGELIHYLIDNVSKNGYLLLNIGPKADGTFPEEARAILKEMGKWLSINGEAIYGTTPWFVSGEGVAQVQKSGAFNENEKPQYTGEDIRFTSKEDAIYATCLGWPGESVTIKTLNSTRIYPGSIKSASMLGSKESLKWQLTDEGMIISTPKTRPCDHAYVFKINRGPAYEA